MTEVITPAPTGGTPAAHAASHENGGSDEIDATGLTGVGGGGGNVSTLPAGAITIGSLALADRPPTSPGTYDEEFDGTADTLPANWAWTVAPSGADEWTLNSRWPSLLTVEGSANTGYTLTRTGFSAATQFGIWVKMHSGPHGSPDKADVRLYVANAGLTEQRGVQLRATAANVPNARGVRINASVETEVGVVALGAGQGTIYMGITRGASDTFTHWYSKDGLQWTKVAATAIHAFTVDRIRVVMSTYIYQSFIALDWIRYRTDTLFPRP